MSSMDQRQFGCKISCGHLNNSCNLKKHCAIPTHLSFLENPLESLGISCFYVNLTFAGYVQMTGLIQQDPHAYEDFKVLLLYNSTSNKF